MTNSKMLIGLIWFYLLAQLICNIWGGREMYEEVAIYPLSVNNSDNSSFFQTDQMEDDLGSSIMLPRVINDIWGTIRKVFTYDYPIFKNVDGSDNDFVLLRWLLTAIAVVMWLDLFITFKRR